MSSNKGNKKGKNKGVTVQNFITQSHGSNHFDGGNNAVKDSFTNDKKKKSKAAYWTIYSLITLGITVFGGIIVWSMTQHLVVASHLCSPANNAAFYVLPNPRGWVIRLKVHYLGESCDVPEESCPGAELSFSLGQKM